MFSKFHKKRDKAIQLRKLGKSIRSIESALSIPRSTLSGWFKNITLSTSQKKILKQQWLDGLKIGRNKAVLWHNKQKANRIGAAKNQALTILKQVNDDDATLELSLAMLYLGEGSKKNRFSIGNSDPRILKFFVKSIVRLYDAELNKIRCDLNLRADQNIKELKAYWSQKLEIPLSCFRTASLDQRTMGSKTYPHYMGVCQVSYPGLALQRRLLFIAELYCDRVVKK